MSANFLVANALSGMKNAISSKIKKPSAVICSTKFIDEIINALIKYKIIESFEVIDESKNIKKVNLVKFFLNPKLKPIDMVKIVSTPSNRVFMNVDEIKTSNILKGMRLVFISTSLGLLEKKEALLKKAGGEIVFGIMY